MEQRPIPQDEPPGAAGHTSLRPYWLAWGATVVFFAGFYSLLTPLPRYLQAVGLADWQIGLVLGAFGVAALLGRPLAGVAADRWGARRVMLAGAAALFVGALGVGYTANVFLLFGLRLLQATGYAAFTTSGTALVVALTHPAERSRRLSIFGAAANVAMTLAPAAISALLAIMPLEMSFWIVAGLALTAGVMASRVRYAHTVASRQIVWHDLWRFPRVLWLPMFVTGLFALGFGAFLQFSPILADRRGGLPSGTLYTTYGIGIIMTRLVSAHWLDRAGAGRALAMAATLLGGGLALAAFAQSLAWLAAAALLIAAGSGLFHPTLLAHHAYVLPGAPGRSSAAFYVGFDLGLGLGSWILGVVLQMTGVTGLFLCAAFLVATAPAFLRALLRE